MIDLTMDMMTYGLSEEVVVILIAVAGSVIVLLIIIIITACLYCGEKKDNKEAGNVEYYLPFTILFSCIFWYCFCVPVVFKVCFLLFGN